MMAILQRTNQSSAHEQTELLLQLATEWQEPRSDAEPIIIQESPISNAPPNHLYVIWQKWSGLSPMERSRLIMDAYRSKLGPENIALIDEVTVAMGLTPEEAQRIGIDF